MTATAARPRAPRAREHASRAGRRPSALGPPGSGAHRRRAGRGLRDRLPAHPGPGRAPVPRPPVQPAGLRPLEQRLVRRPPHPRLQRAVPGGLGAAHPAARRRARRHGDRGAVRAAGSPAFRSRRLARGAGCSAPPPRSTSTPGGWPWPSARSPRWRAVVALDRDLPLAAAGLGLLSGAVQPRGRAVRGAGRGGLRARGGARAARGSRAALPGVAIAVAALAPVLALAVAFPEGGTEPFELGTLLPVLAICAVALLATRARRTALRAGIALYALAAVAHLRHPLPDRQQHRPPGHAAGRPAGGAVVVAPAPAAPGAVRAAAALHRLAGAGVRHRRAVAATRRRAPPTTGRCCASSRPSPAAASMPSGSRSRSRNSHWEAYRVAPRVPLARGWERQLDRRRQPALLRRAADGGVVRPVAASTTRPLRRAPRRPARLLGAARGAH